MNEEGGVEGKEGKRRKGGMPCRPWLSTYTREGA